MKNYLLCAAIFLSANSLLSMDFGPKPAITMRESRSREKRYNENCCVTIINKIPTSPEVNQLIKIEDNCRNDHSLKALLKEKSPYDLGLLCDSTSTYIGSNNGIKLYVDMGDERNLKLGADRTKNATLILSIFAAIKNKNVELNIGEASRIKYGDTVKVTYKWHDGKINIKHDHDVLLSLPTREKSKEPISIGLIDQVIYYNNPQ